MKRRCLYLVPCLIVLLMMAVASATPQDSQPPDLDRIRQEYEKQRSEHPENTGVREGDLVYGKGTPYDRWIETFKKTMPVIDDYRIEDLKAVPVHYWDEFGVPVAYIRFTDVARQRALQREILVLEIPPGQSTKAHRHLYEEVQVVLSGRGYTELQQEGRRLQQVEWGEGTFFATPLNVMHRHVNNGTTPARVLMVNTAPVIINTFGTRDAAYSSTFAFRDRYDAREDFARVNTNLKSVHDEIKTDRYWNRNFVKDLREVVIPPRPYRGVGAGQIEWLMAGNSVLVTHMSNFPIGVYRQAHKHGGGPLLYIVSGQGYSLLWEDGKFESRARVDWKTGSVVAVPPGTWWHQHFNTSLEPVRYLAIRGGTPRGFGGDGDGDGEGGNPPQIAYKDEDPRVRAEFLAELKKNGVTSRLPEFK